MKTPIINFALAVAVVFVCAPGFAQPESTRPLSPIYQALEHYQQYSGKTVLRSPNLPHLSEFNAPILSSDTNGMKVVLEDELSKHGIEFIPLREVFVLAVESGWKNSARASYVATIKSRHAGASISPLGSPASAGGKPVEEALPPGTIDFRGADLNQFLNLYETLINRNLLRSTRIQSAGFELRTQTALVKDETIYMLEVLLALNGIATVEDGTNFVQVVPLKEVANLKLHAPPRNPDERLLDPKTIRNIGWVPFVPGKRQEISRQSPVNDLVAYYAELTGRTAVPSGQAGGISVLFRAQTPLTKPELLYALETTLDLSGLAIIEGDQKTIRAGYISEQNRARK